MINILKNKKLVKYLLLILIVLGVMLRFWDFGNIPISLNRDEAALAYNAYAIATEGVDEWSVSFPFLFESFGDYKLPGYIYTVSFLVKLFSISDTVVRIPSLIAGLVIILLTYFIGKIVYQKDNLALLASVIISLSPWAIFYSRMAWEANLALMWLLMVVWLILRKSTSIWNYGVIFLAYTLAVITYNTPLLLSVVLVPFILFQTQKKLSQRLVYTGIIVGVAILVASLLMPLTSQKQAITIFSDPTIAWHQQDRYMSSGGLVEKLNNHKYSNWARISVKNSINSFGPKFLVFDGGANPWHSIPGRGHMYLVVFVLFLMSLVLIIAEVVKKKFKWISWLVLLFGSLLPSIVTVDAPHATRSLFFFWIVGFLSVYVLDKYRILFWPFIAGLLIEVAIFIYGYFIFFPANMPGAWPTNIDASISEAYASSEDNTIWITNTLNSNQDLMAEQVYIYLLLYAKILPSQYNSTLVQLERDNVGLVRIKSFQNFVIENNRKNVPEEAIMVEGNEQGYYELK